jgi:hypothetical protein
VSLEAPVAPVRWVGAQRDVLAGGIGGLVDLRTLAGRPPLDALGPLEGCRGELSVFDVPRLARPGSVSPGSEERTTGRSGWS